MKRHLWHAKEREVGDMKATVKTTAVDELNKIENGREAGAVTSQPRNYALQGDTKTF